MKSKPNILLGVSGSVSAILYSRIVDNFELQGNNVQSILTKSSIPFIEREHLEITEHYQDEDEWQEWNENKSVLHIDLRNWADCLVVAPATMNTTSKFSLGISDNLLTNVFAAWDFKKPVFIAPAMNTFMYENSITQFHIEKLISKGCYFIEPQTKKLACGDTGTGALAEIKNIVQKVSSYFGHVSEF